MENVLVHRQGLKNISPDRSGAQSLVGVGFETQAHDGMCHVSAKVCSHYPRLSGQ